MDTAGGIGGLRSPRAQDTEFNSQLGEPGAENPGPARTLGPDGDSEHLEEEFTEKTNFPSEDHESAEKSLEIDPVDARTNLVADIVSQS